MAPKGTAARSFVGRIGHRREVVLPKQPCDDAGSNSGDQVGVSMRGHLLVLKPRKIAVETEQLTVTETKSGQKGAAQIRRGAFRAWRDIRRELDR